MCFWKVNFLMYNTVTIEWGTERFSTYMTLRFFLEIRLALESSAQPVFYCTAYVSSLTLNCTAEGNDTILVLNLVQRLIQDWKIFGAGTQLHDFCGVNEQVPFHFDKWEAIYSKRYGNFKTKINKTEKIKSFIISLLEFNLWEWFVHPSRTWSRVCACVCTRVCTCVCVYMCVYAHVLCVLRMAMKVLEHSLCWGAV